MNLKYINLFIGYSNNIQNRNKGSSGGVGTEILQYLLKSREVDIAIGVGFDPNDNTRPIYKVAMKPPEVLELSGSKYAYMEIGPLRDIISSNNDKRIAVVSQPCLVHILKKIAPPVKYTISFFCGYNISYEATNYLISKSRTEKTEILGIDYRGGSYPGGFTVYKRNGDIRRFGKECYELVDLLFLEKDCRKCHRYISQEADLVLGDVWAKNIKKSTAIVINTESGDRIIKDMHREGLLTLYDLGIDDLERMHRHNLRYKEHGHSWLMKLAVKLFNNKLAQKISPLCFFSFLSKIRRRLMVGINIDLVKTRKYGRA